MTTFICDRDLAAKMMVEAMERAGVYDPRPVPLTLNEIAKISQLIPLSPAARYTLALYIDDNVILNPIYYRVIRMVEGRLRYFYPNRGRANATQS